MTATVGSHDGGGARRWPRAPRPLTPLDQRPTWRGWIHAVAFFVSLPAGLLLVLAADEGSARVATGVYVTSLLLGFGASAAYHRLARAERTRLVMQRVDHAMIYVLIAGSYTPLCVLALPRDTGVPLLVAAWAGAAAGIGFKLARSVRVRLLSHTLYPLLGWMAVFAVPAMVRSFSTVEMVLFVATGVFYTGGIPVLARRRPDPWPRTFGYHELWHACTVAAAACHFAIVGLLVA